MIMAKEQAILKGQVQFDQMVGFVRQAARDGRAIDEVERSLWQKLLSLGLTMLDSYVQDVGPGDVGETLEHQGQELRRLEAMHQRRYVSVFGELPIKRYVYGTRETQKHQVIPADAVLCLPDGDFSELLAEWDQSFCVQGSYQSSRETVQRILGLGQSVRSLEQMSVSMAKAVDGYRASQPIPPAEEEGAIMVLTADCKGVPMRREAGEESPTVNGHRNKGEKANKKRMACVGGIYSIEPFVRTAEDVVDEVLRDASQADRPKPCGKKLRAELTRPIDGVEVNGKERIFEWLAEEVKFRNASGEKPVVCVMDGERALWKLLTSMFVGVVCILDIFHVLERLWQAAHCFCQEGSQAASDFVTDRLTRLLRGEVGYVIGGLRQMASKRKLSGWRRRQLTTVIGYLQTNRRLMHYDTYLAAGFPIGSGVAEGACRHLVKDRMELTGMRWRVPGAQAILDLRAVHINGDWDDFQQYRVAEDRRRLYPYRSELLRVWKKAA